MSELGRKKTDQTQEIVKKLKDFESPASLSFMLSSMSLPVAKGEGAYVTDIDGNHYLDLIAGFGALPTGHSHPKIIEAVGKQSKELVHAFPLTSAIRTQLLEKIATLTPGPAEDKVTQFGVGGSDAVEIALKQARHYSKKPGIIAFEGAYHGRTTGALALTGFNVFRRGQGPLIYGIHHIPYAYCYRCAFGLEYPACDLQCARYLERKVSAPFTGIEAGAVIVEAVQGVGGMVTPPLEFLAEIRRICDKHEIVLIVDEVMSGWARTGKMFACEHSEIVPDILVSAKAIASGYPLSAVVSQKFILEDATPSTEGFTFSGNIVSCAAALATMEVIEKEKLVEKAAEIGNYFRDQLKGLQEQFAFIGEVRNRGMMIAMEMVKDRNSKEPLPVGPIVEKLMSKGLLVYYGGYYRNVVAFLPPLILTKNDVDEAVKIMELVFKEVA